MPLRFTALRFSIRKTNAIKSLALQAARVYNEGIKQ
jgi:hypothetical protein